MSKISYFQRYSQRENHVTNNTLLVLRHFYQASPFKLERILNSLLDEELAIGLSFQQQVRGGKGVLDARIFQPSLFLGVETKLDDSLWRNQIERHVDSMAASRQDSGAGLILIGLTKEPAPNSDLKQMEAYAKAKGVTFKAVTFSQLIESLREACAEYEQSLFSILEDYESFVENEGLLHDRGKWIVVFPCGTSYQENERYCLYYEGQERPSKRGCKFIGIYKRKAVSLIGEIDTIVVCSLINQHLEVIDTEFGQAREEQLNRIREVVKITKYYDLSVPHRFYLTDRLYKTKVEKRSKGGLWGYRRLSIPELLGSAIKPNEIGAEDLANKLSGSAFE